MISLQRETLAAIKDDIEVLLRLHYEEVALHREHIPLDPDWTRYAALEKTGNLHIFTARTDGRLIGYSVFFTVQHIHYNQTKVASNDVLFLHPDCRKGSTAGVKLIRFSEQELKAIGVHKITWHAKFSNSLRHLLNRMGYCDEEVIVGKML